MAIKTKIGLAGGSLESLNIGVTVWDTSPGGGVLSMAIARDAAVAALAVQFPTGIAGLLPGPEPKDVGVKERRASNIYEFEFSYQPAEELDKLPPVPPTTGAVVRRAATNAKSVKLSKFLEPIGVYNSLTGSNISGQYPHLKWQIDAASHDGHYQRNQERTFDPLTETQHRLWHPPNATVTNVLLDSIEELLGRFNDGLYLGRPAGSLQFVRFEAAPRNRDDWEFYFGFGYKAPRPNVLVSDEVKIPTVRGCDYFWTREKQHYTAGTKILQTKTDIAVLGRVWELDSFAALGLP